MTTNEIVGRLKAGGLDASSTNRSAAVYVTEARSGRAEPGWFGFRIVCDSEATERRVRSILSRWYDIEASGNVWQMRAKNRVPLMAIKRGGVPPTPPTPTIDPTWLYFTMPDGGTVTLTKNGTPTAVTLEYSLDNGSTWTEWTESGNVRTKTLTAGQVVHIRNTSPTSTSFSSGSSSFYQFSFDADTHAGGNIMSLLCSDPSLATMTSYCFRSLFNGSIKLQTVDMSGVTSISNYGCDAMFSGCKSLTTVEMRNVTSIDSYGCNSMFFNCTSLTTVDIRNVTSIGNGGCSNMCYGCTHLSTVIIDNPTMSSSSLSGWLINVSQTGDFYCSASLTIQSGSSGIPTGWTRHDI